jgi:hypothetical protein
MSNQQESSKGIHITLWVAQVVLAAGLMFGAVMKLFQPVSELSAMWPWTGEVPVAAVKATGIIDLLGTIGLIVPMLLRIKSVLTPVAALGVVTLMICASVFHIARGEASEIGVNLFFAGIAAFVAWGRFRKAPVTAQ